MEGIDRCGRVEDSVRLSGQACLTGELNKGVLGAVPLGERVARNKVRAQGETSPS